MKKIVFCGCVLLSVNLIVPTAQGEPEIDEIEAAWNELAPIGSVLVHLVADKDGEHIVGWHGNIFRTPEKELRELTQQSITDLMVGLKLPPSERYVLLVPVPPKDRVQMETLTVRTEFVIYGHRCAESFAPDGGMASSIPKADFLAPFVERLGKEKRLTEKALKEAEDSPDPLIPKT